MCNAAPGTHPGFTHLHAHTGFSLGDATAMPFYGDYDKKETLSVCPLRRAADLGFRSYSITDHGSMSGVIPFYKAALLNNVKPILGNEAYFTPDAKKKKVRDYNHILLLAKSLKGYRALLKATTFSYVEGFYYKPRIDWKVLESLEDVICTSACVGGMVNKAFLKSDFQDVETGFENAKRLKEIFGDDFYIELQMHHTQVEMFQKCNDFSIEVARKLGVPLVFTNDVHFVNQSDMEAHRVWKACGSKKSLTDPSFSYVYDDSFYIKSVEEMRAICPVPEAIENSMAIDDKIDWIDLNLGISRFPSFEDLTLSQSNDRLKEMVKKALQDSGLVNNPEYVRRAAQELKFLYDNDLSPYFHPLADIVRQCKEDCVNIGPGRGSAGGSLIVNLLGITQVDPLQYGLKFSRFLNPGRVQKRQMWKVECEDGSTTEIVEGFKYHIKNESGHYSVKLGEDLIREFEGR